MNKVKLASAGVFAAVVIGGGALIMNQPPQEVPPSTTPISSPAAAPTATPSPTAAPPASPGGTTDAAPSPTPATPDATVPATLESSIEPPASPTPSTPTSEGGPPAFPIEAVLADFAFTCTGENDLVIATGPTWVSYGASAPDIWGIGQWGIEKGMYGAETLILFVGEDQPAAEEYTVHNYISAKPPFYYDLTLEAYAQQVEGEPVLLDEGLPTERLASRGELFYPGDHGIEPVASETVHLLCDGAGAPQWVAP